MYNLKQQNGEESFVLADSTFSDSMIERASRRNKVIWYRPRFVQGISLGLQLRVRRAGHQSFAPS